jgi:hypothetical protein
MQQLNTAESSAIRVFFSAEKDQPSLTTTNLPERSSITFNASIADCIRALQEGSKIKDTEIELAEKTSPAQVTDILITRAIIRPEQKNDIHESILKHTRPLPILNRVLILINEESRRSNLMQEIEQQSTGYESKSLEQLRVLSAISTPESASQFDSALKKYRLELSLHKAPSAKEFASYLVRDVLDAVFLVSSEDLTLLADFTGIYIDTKNINYQFSNVDAFLESLLKQGWIEANNKEEIRKSILVYDPADIKPALYVLKLLHVEVVRRQKTVNHYSAVATEYGLELSEEIYNSVNKISYNQNKFNSLVDDIKTQLNIAKALESPSVARWVPKSELEQIRQLPQAERISQSYEIITRCQKLKPLEELSTSLNTINEDIIALIVGRTGAEKGEELNAAKEKLLEKLKSIDITSTCSASVRADLVTLSEQLVDLRQQAHYERATIDHARIQAENDWQTLFNPM